MSCGGCSTQTKATRDAPALRATRTRAPLRPGRAAAAAPRCPALFCAPVAAESTHALLALHVGLRAWCAHLGRILRDGHPHVARIGQPAQGLMQLRLRKAVLARKVAVSARAPHAQRQATHRKQKQRARERGAEVGVRSGSNAGVSRQRCYRLVHPSGHVQRVPGLQVVQQARGFDDAVLDRLRRGERERERAW